MSVSSQQGTTIRSNESLRVMCKCGQPVSLTGERFLCACGAEAGKLVEGVAVLTGPTPYWGEISQDIMQKLISEGGKMGWRKAVDTYLPERERDRITDRARAAFQDVLPIPPQSRVLDVGAGLGIIATELARHHRVTALEGVWERARFIALRGQEDGLSSLTVINGDLNSVELEEGQFDAIVVNGVLEWVGLFDLSAAPELVQRRFLEKLRKLLKPKGIIYLAIENRIGWNMFRGERDHSGLKYTSLMPRWMARWVCSRNPDYRSNFNTGYRTYTYSFWGYRSLFAKAGLRIATPYIAISGYTRPTDLIPITTAAVRGYTFNRWMSPAASTRARVKNFLKRRMSSGWFWRAFGPDFAFILEKRDA